MNAVNNERIDCSFCKGFWEFTREVPAETSLLNWVQGSLFSRVHVQIGGRAGVFREIGGSLGKVGEGEGKALVFDWGNGDGALFPIDDWVHCFQPGMS